MAIILWVALCFCIRERPNLTVELDSSAFFAQRIVHAVTDLLSFILNSFQPSPLLPSPPLPFHLSKLPLLWKPSNHIHRFRRKKSSNDRMLASAKAMDIEVDEDLYLLMRWFLHLDANSRSSRSCVRSHGLGLTRLAASTFVLGGLGLNAFNVRNISVERAELVFGNFTVLKVWCHILYTVLFSLFSLKEFFTDWKISEIREKGKSDK